MAKTTPDFSIEKKFCGLGFELICGVDEAGRGPLAGSVYAAAVILPHDCVIEGLNDSKKLSEKKREQLFDVITEQAVAYCVASASVEEIERLNILGATMLAMTRAVGGLNPGADFALIDGNRVPSALADTAASVVGGDAKSFSIAAASVLAKVSRDRCITELDAKYPQYNFKKHKGYGTKEHIAAIREFGPCEIHRPSFLRNILKG